MNQSIDRSINQSINQSINSLYSARVNRRRKKMDKFGAALDLFFIGNNIWQSMALEFTFRLKIGVYAYMLRETVLSAINRSEHNNGLVCQLEDAKKLHSNGQERSIPFKREIPLVTCCREEFSQNVLRRIQRFFHLKYWAHCDQHHRAWDISNRTHILYCSIMQQSFQQVRFQPRRICYLYIFYERVGSDNMYPNNSASNLRTYVAPITNV